MLGAPEREPASAVLSTTWAHWLHGEFGVSYTYFPYTVTDMIGRPLPWTIVLVGVTTILASSSAPCSARGRPGGATACSTPSSASARLLGTLPFFWIALLLIYVFAFKLSWFPDGGGFGGGSSTRLELGVHLTTPSSTASCRRCRS